MYKIRVSKLAYNALTEIDVDKLVFSSDYNTLKYSLANGSRSVVVNTNAPGYYSFQEEITHGLGYKPFFKAYAFWAGYSPVGIFTIVDNHNIHLMVTVDDNKMYFIASGNNVGEIITTGTSLIVPYAQFYTDRYDTLCEMVDYSSRNQCVDLVVAWFMKLGYSQFVLTGVTKAYEIFTNTPAIVQADFDRIEYTVTNSPPRKGDIVVWNSAMGGGFGHTGIATGTGDSSYFDCFQQNDDPYGGNPNITSKCHSVTYPYTNVLGWLRYKNSTPTTIITIDNINFTANFRYKIFKNKLNL